MHEPLLTLRGSVLRTAEKIFARRSADMMAALRSQAHQRLGRKFPDLGFDFEMLSSDEKITLVCHVYASASQAAEARAARTKTQADPVK